MAETSLCCAVVLIRLASVPGSTMGGFGSFEYDSTSRQSNARAKELASALVGGSRFLADKTNAAQFNSGSVLLYRQGDAGELSVTATSALPHILDGSLDREFSSAGTTKVAAGRKRVRFSADFAKKFRIDALLLDTELHHKFSITPAMLARLRSLAVDDARAAALIFEKHVRKFDDYRHAEVLWRDYGNTWKVARESLKSYSASYPMVTLNTDAFFCGDRIFIYSGRDDQPWKVCGHERVASLVRLVHRIVSSTSPQEANLFLNRELCLLDIDIIVGDTVLTGNTEVHTAPHDTLEPGLQLSHFSSLSVNARLKLSKLSRNLLLVTSAGEACATAVRVSPLHAATCEHVCANSGLGSLEINSQPMLAPFSPSGDLVVSRNVGEYEPWHLRVPRIGERIILCYKRYNEVEFAGPAVILSCSQTNITYTNVNGVRPGMSGAAIVSLEDLALFGFHSGVSLSSAFAVRYTPAVSSLLWVADNDVSVVDSAKIESIGAPLALIKRRGLQDICRVCSESLIPIYYENKLRGCALRVKPNVAVTVNSLAGYCPVVQGVENPVGSSRTDPAMRFVYGVAAGNVPTVFREPNYGEHVIIIGVDAQGPMVSSTDVKVSQVFDDKTFQLSGIEDNHQNNSLGCAVVSLRDGAVLGITLSLAPAVISEASTALCAVVDCDLDDGDLAPLISLERLFPNIEASRWFGESCREASQDTFNRDGRVEEFARDVLAMSMERKRMYSCGQRVRLSDRDILKYLSDVVLGRAVMNIDNERSLVGLKESWKIEGEDETLVYSRILLYIVYFVDKYEPSRKIMELIDLLALFC